MSKPTIEEIKSAIKHIDDHYLFDVMDIILLRLENNKEYLINRTIEGTEWEILCINPHGELYSEKIL